jgi:hypothetical protein
MGSSDLYDCAAYTEAPPHGNLPKMGLRGSCFLDSRSEIHGSQNRGCYYQWRTAVAMANICWSRYPSPQAKHTLQPILYGSSGLVSTSIRNIRTPCRKKETPRGNGEDQYHGSRGVSGCTLCGRCYAKTLSTDCSTFSFPSPQSIKSSAGSQSWDKSSLSPSIRVPGTYELLPLHGQLPTKSDLPPSIVIPTNNTIPTKS